MDNYTPWLNVISVSVKFHAIVNQTIASLKQFFLIAALGLLTSCYSYHQISLQVLQPAQVKINKDVHKIVLVNHSNYRKSSIVTISEPIAQPNLDSIRTSQYFSGLMQVLDNSPRYTVVNQPVEYIVKESYTDRFKALDWAQIAKICADSAADAALVLENYQITYADPISISYTSEYGYYGSMEMENIALWKLYIPSQKIIADDYLLTDTLFWDGSGNFEFEVLQKIPPINDATQQSCYYAGIKYGEHIAPQWVTQRRILYACEVSDFQQAILYANAGAWEKAIAIWKKYPYASKKRLAGYAAYNLAVACEALDNVDAALEWAAKSYLLLRDTDIEKYIRILENRKKEKIVIEEQFY